MVAAKKKKQKSNEDKRREKEEAIKYYIESNFFLQKGSELLQPFYKFIEGAIHLGADWSSLLNFIFLYFKKDCVWRVSLHMLFSIPQHFNNNNNKKKKENVNLWA